MKPDLTKLPMWKLNQVRLEIQLLQFTSSFEAPTVPSTNPVAANRARVKGYTLNVCLQEPAKVFGKMTSKPRRRTELSNIFV